MSPLEIEIMIWHYTHECSPDMSFRDGAPNTLESGLLDSFADHGYLHSSEIGKHTITDGGKMYVEALMTVPLPRRAWFMPEKDDG